MNSQTREYQSEMSRIQETENRALTLSGCPLRLDRHCHTFHNVAQHLIRLLRLFSGRSVLPANHHTMSEHGNRQRLEILRSAKAPPFKKRHSLSRPI